MDSPTGPLISMVVVTWNGAGILGACVDSLRAQDGLAVPPEVIVVDNGSTDDTLALLARDYPWVTVVALPTNTGFTGGANAGVAAASGDFVGLINNDATADPHFISRAMAALESAPTAGAVTGLLVLADRYSPAPPGTPGALVSAEGAAWVRDPEGVTLVNSTGGEVTRSGNGRDRDWLADAVSLSRRAGDVAGFSGGATLLRRTALEQVGSFDERLFMYYEDSDLAFRLRRAGWRVIFEPTAVVRHRHAASSGTESQFFLFHNERNRVLFAVKHAPAKVVLAAVGRTLGGAARALLRRDSTAALRKGRALASAVRLAPGFLRDRRRIDSAATVSRAAVWRNAPRD